MNEDLEARFKKFAEELSPFSMSIRLSMMTSAERDHFMWKLRLDELICRLIAYTGETRENIEGFIDSFAPMHRETILLRMADFAHTGGNIYRAQLNDWVHKHAIEQAQMDIQERLATLRRNLIVSRWLE